MKIRRGFVSNSSSSSFTCDVCGNTESGMDASLNDFDMSQCEHGHTFCNSHRSHTPTFEEMRKHLIDIQKARNYAKPEDIQTEVKKLTEMTDGDIEIEFDDVVGSYEVPACTCPICTMEKIADYDALLYLLKRFDITKNDVLAEIKAKFNGDYQAFDAFVRPPKKV